MYQSNAIQFPNTGFFQVFLKPCNLRPCCIKKCSFRIDFNPLCAVHCNSTLYGRSVCGNILLSSQGQIVVLQNSFSFALHNNLTNTHFFSTTISSPHLMQIPQVRNLTSVRTNCCASNQLWFCFAQ